LSSLQKNVDIYGISSRFYRVNRRLWMPATGRWMGRWNRDIPRLYRIPWRRSTGTGISPEFRIRADL